jgi:hypothetical protein
MRGAVPEILRGAAAGRSFQAHDIFSLFFPDTVGSYQDVKRSNSCLGFDFSKPHPHLDVTRGLQRDFINNLFFIG